MYTYICICIYKRILPTGLAAKKPTLVLNLLLLLLLLVPICFTNLNMQIKVTPRHAYAITEGWRWYIFDPFTRMIVW